MQEEDSQVRTAEWVAPGPGAWLCEASHFPRPVTATVADLYARLSAGAMRAACARYGLPIDGFRFELVNGWTYSSPVVAGRRELVARSERAVDVLVERPWLADAADWFEADRPRWIARDLALQDVDVAALDDASLAHHVLETAAVLREGAVRHFELHLSDMIPTGLLLVAARDQGLADEEVLDALVGSTPASAHDPDLVAVAAAVRASQVDLRSLDQVGELGAAAVDAMARHLRHHGWRSASRWDVDAPTVCEHPGLTVAAIRRLANAPAGDSRPALVTLPVEPSLVQDALATFGLRDDNAAILGSWPMGLMRRALLESGRRLSSQRIVSSPALALDATPDEVAALLLGHVVVGDDELERRAGIRSAASELKPPPTLGDDADLPLEAGAESLQLFGALGLYAELMEAATAEPLSGVGIGSAPYVGRAIVAHSPDEAIAELLPGDVLVAFATSPAYDHLLAAAGALVTVTGGPLSHAAIAARELGIVAVLGAAEATMQIHTGDLVEVDPVRGQVSLVAADR